MSYSLLPPSYLAVVLSVFTISILLGMVQFWLTCHQSSGIVSARQSLHWFEIKLLAVTGMSSLCSESTSKNVVHTLCNSHWSAAVTFIIDLDFQCNFSWMFISSDVVSLIPRGFTFPFLHRFLQDEKARDKVPASPIDIVYYYTSAAIF